MLCALYKIRFLNFPGTNQVFHALYQTQIFHAQNFSCIDNFSCIAREEGWSIPRYPQKSICPSSSRRYPDSKSAAQAYECFSFTTVPQTDLKHFNLQSSLGYAWLTGQLMQTGLDTFPEPESHRYTIPRILQVED